LPSPRLPLPLQVVAAAVLTPAESFLASHITQLVCDYTDLFRREWMTWGDLGAFAFLLGLFVFVAWLKERAGMCVGVIAVMSLLVALSVCMDMWHVRIP
jgi:hypothetical protein